MKVYRMSTPKQTSIHGASANASTHVKVVGQYVLTDLLGRGSFAKVFKGYHKSNSDMVVAVKVILKATYAQHPRLQQSLASEISIMKEIQHPNIVRMIDIMESEKNIYIVMEFCDGKDMSHYLAKHKPLKEEVARHFLSQLATGLRVLRDHKVTHRDLKPQNLLLTSSTEDATLKIADFGFARSLLPNSMADTVCGSPLYMAPEILNAEPYNATADLWSVGVILWEMLTGKVPYPAMNHIELKHAIDKKTLNFSGLAVSADCRDILENLLKVRPEDRITFERFFDHPFLHKPSAQKQGQAEVPQSVPVVSNAGSSSMSGSSLATSPASNSKLYPNVRVPKANPFKMPVPAITNPLPANDSPTVASHRPFVPDHPEEAQDSFEKDYVIIRGYDEPKNDILEDIVGRIIQHTNVSSPLTDQARMGSRMVAPPVDLSISGDDVLSFHYQPKSPEKVLEFVLLFMSLAEARQTQQAIEDAYLLYVRALDKIQALIQHIRSVPNVRVNLDQNVLSRIQSSYEVCLERAQAIEARGFEKQRSGVSLDKWLYESALNSCREGAVAEWSGNYPVAVRHYTWSMNILMHLCEQAKSDTTDSNVLRHYVQSLVRRLHLVKRKLTPISSTSSSPSSTN